MARKLIKGCGLKFLDVLVLLLAASFPEGMKCQETGSEMSHHCQYLLQVGLKTNANGDFAVSPFKIYTRSRAPEVTSGYPIEAMLVTMTTAQTTDASSHCAYLVNSVSRFQPNSAAFKIYTRSRSPRVTSGEPIEVTIGPVLNTMSFFNFSDFIMYATPANTANLEIEILGGPSPHVGVFQLFDKWRAGAGGLNCNPRSRAEDSVGAFEDRLLATFKQYYPNHPMLNRYHSSARNQISVLWWPTKEALIYPEIKFVANIKSMGNWFKLQSTPWKVNRPVDQWAMTESMLTQYQALQNNMRAMERRMEQPL